ncbi:hypothetical protein ACQP2P_03700 [Dactylosporangium sp. CA-139114]|uniref:hypothetical protein n=1 Tax=Dactylosporangium sp. CA-139114 TaxID=3239931 RepID=UPI003D974C7E
MTELGIITHTILSATAPFDLGCSLRALADFRPGRRDISLRPGERVRRAFPHPADPDAAVVVEVAERDDGAPGAGLTVFSAEPLAGPDLDAVRARVSGWLGLDDDRAEFLRRAEADECVRPLLEVARGLHQVRFSSLAEGVVYFTLLQNSTQWYATLHKRRLTLYLGASVRAGDEDFTAIPDLPRLARLSPAEVLPYVGVRNKAERLTEVLGGVAAIDEELLRTGPYDEARAALLAVRGIGDYTAHALLLRALGRPDAVPLEMEQYAHTARAVYGAAQPSPDELRERYGPFIGWWAYTCRTALTWLEQDEKARERSARRRPPAARRPRSTAGSTRPRSAARHPAPWSPNDPGPALASLEPPAASFALSPTSPSSPSPSPAAVPGSPSSPSPTAVPGSPSSPSPTAVPGSPSSLSPAAVPGSPSSLSPAAVPGSPSFSLPASSAFSPEAEPDLAIEPSPDELVPAEVMVG